MTQKTSVHTYTVTYEENAVEGIHYLRDNLDHEEARVFFDQARARGSAEFEDPSNRQFSLLYQNGAYALTRR